MGRTRRGELDEAWPADKGGTVNMAHEREETERRRRRRMKVSRPRWTHHTELAMVNLGPIGRGESRSDTDSGSDRV